MDKNDDPKALASSIRNTRQVEGLLRQFLSTDGPKGATSDYKRGWARNFGRATGQHSGSLSTSADGLPECVGCKVCDCTCDDAGCWCHRPDDSGLTGGAP